MAHRGHGLAPPGKACGNAAVDPPKALGRLAEPPLGAVLPNQRMQAQRVRRPAGHRLQQPRQRRDGLQAPLGVHRLQRLVQQPRLHPLEQAGVQQQVAFGPGQAAQQPGPHPVVGDVRAPARLVGLAAVPLVAQQAQRDRPAPRLALQRRGLAGRRVRSQEPGHVRTGEPQVLSGQDLAAARQRRRGEVELRRKLPAGDREVQVRRTPFHQAAEQRQGAAVAQLLQLVEHQHAGRAVPLDGHGEQPGPVPEGSGPVPLKVGGAQGVEHAQAGPFEGERDVGVEGLRRIVPVHRQPGGNRSGAPELAAGFRPQHRLAEAARRPQHGDAPGGGVHALQQAGAVDVAGHPVGHQDLVVRQPGWEFGRMPRLGCRPGAVSALAASAFIVHSLDECVAPTRRFSVFQGANATARRARFWIPEFTVHG